MKIPVALVLCVLLVEGSSRDPDPYGDIKERPAKVVSIDHEKGTATLTIEPKSRSRKAQPATYTVSIKGAGVTLIHPPYRKKDGSLTDLKPGTDVSFTGIIAISNNFATEFVIDLRNKKP